MTTPDTVFSTAQNDAAKFNRYEADSVYALAVSIWACYKKLSLVQGDSNLSEDEKHQTLIASIRLYHACVPSIIKEKSISLSHIPEYLTELVENKEKEKIHTSAEFIAICEKCINKNFDLNQMATIIEKVLLLIVFCVLQNLPGDDVFSLMNKCIVLDHLGNRAYIDTDFSMLLKKLNSKVKSSVFSSEQKIDVLRVVSNLNYRLNIYEPAIYYLREYADCLIKRNRQKLTDIFLMDTLLRIFISIGYCHEKINSSESINKAIMLFEKIIKSEDINLNEYGTSSPKSLLYEERVSIQFERCNIDLRTEVYHEIAHFYNERAVFHSYISGFYDIQDEAEKNRINTIRAQRERDIFSAQEYISIAKDLDKNNAYHSCHGLICYENSNYRQALCIYEEALRCNEIVRDNKIYNEELYYELLFYLAQSKAACDKKKEALEDLKDFEAYCEKKHNQDAIAHSRILRTKAILSDLQLYAITTSSKIFQDLLDEILEQKLSMYVPTSVQVEWQKLIFALNSFYYIRCIVENKIAFPDGVEEISFNLQKYRQLQKELEKIQRFEFTQDKLLGELSQGGHRDNGIYFIDFKEIQLLCFGDFTALDRKKYKNVISFRGQVKRTFEESILRQIKSNRTADIVLFTPSVDLLEENQANQLELFKSMISSGVCVVTYTELGKSIVEKIITANDFQNVTVYNATTDDELLRISFCFRVYEILRYDLITPTPLLGLAPLSDSKSFSYQAGIKTEDLVVPALNNPLTPNHVAIDNRMYSTALGTVLKQLDEIQQAMHKKAKTPKDYRTVIEYYRKVLRNIEGLTLLAFFPNPKENGNNFFTTPFYIQNTDDIAYLKYIPFKEKEIYSFPPCNPVDSYALDYQACLNKNQRRDLCTDAECLTLICKASGAIISQQSENASAILAMLRHIFHIKAPRVEYGVAWTEIEHENNKGLLVAVMKAEKSDINSTMHEICKAIQRREIPAIGTTRGRNPNSPALTNTIIYPSNALKRQYEKKLKELKEQLEEISTDDSLDTLSQKGDRLVTDLENRSITSKSEYLNAINDIENFLQKIRGE